MARRLIQKILGLFKKGRERLLVVEEVDNRLEVTEAMVNNFDKKIEIKNKKIFGNFGDLKQPLFPFDKLILALDSSAATTIESTVNLKRSEPQTAIDEDELDALVFKGLWEFLNHYRSWAAKKMKISELDLVLTNICVTEVRLSGHRVFNPIGFKSKDFTLSFKGTFTPRSFISVAERLRYWTKSLYIVEGKSVLTEVVSQLINDFVVHADESKTTVFITKPDERIYFREYPWGSEKLISALAKNFAVDEKTAKIILERYTMGFVSPRMSRLIENEFKNQFEEFFKMLGPVCSNPVYFHFRITAPIIEELFKSPRLRLVSLYQNLIREGYNISKSDKISSFEPQCNQNTLAYLVYAYDRPQYDFLNKFLRRRAKWLIPNL